MPRFPRCLSQYEIDIILKITEEGTSLGVSVRLGLLAGLRIGEITMVTRSDIKRALQTGLFSVRKEIAKYGKPRTIPVCPRLADSLATWYNRHSTHNVRHLTLWTESKRTIQRRFHDLTIRCQFTFTPHDLRHTFACALYTLCRDLSLVQAALGHANLKTTLVYVHIEGLLQQEIQEAYERFQALPSRMKYGDKISEYQASESALCPTSPKVGQNDRDPYTVPIDSNFAINSPIGADPSPPIGADPDKNDSPVPDVLTSEEYDIELGEIMNDPDSQHPDIAGMKKRQEPR